MESEKKERNKPKFINTENRLVVVRGWGGWKVREMDIFFFHLSKLNNFFQCKKKSGVGRWWRGRWELNPLAFVPNWNTYWSSEEQSE